MTVTVSRRVSLRRGLVLAVAAGLTVLTACTPVKAGQAAVVGDQTLSEDQLAEWADEIQQVATEHDIDKLVSPDLNGRLVGLWVEETLTAELAAREGVSATDTEIDAFLSQFEEEELAQIAASTGIGPSTIRRAAQAQVLQQKLVAVLAPEANSSDEANAALRSAMAEVAVDLGVSVNPRYGAWDSEQARVGDRNPNRLSEPAGKQSEDVPAPLPVG